MVTTAGQREIGLLLLLVGVFAVALLLAAAPAEAHGAHSIPTEAAEAEIETDHAAHGHLGHCHGGAFCPAAAVVALAPVVPEPSLRCGRCARPEPSLADAAPTAFDPPPPRALI